jgi:nicotinate-nucleotide adenylyltransferase
MSQPIGVFGGIFDPVHNGHLAAAYLAYDYFHLEKIIFIPAGIPPHKVKTVTASPSDRLAMLKIALDHFPAAVIWPNEVQRTGISYTIDTLGELEACYKDNPLYFIIGSDNLAEIPDWHHFEAILKKVTLCVAVRPGFCSEAPQLLAHANMKFFPSPQWGLSSTVLRSYIGRGYSCKYLLPPGVQEYIMENGLYKDMSTKSCPDNNLHEGDCHGGDK